MKISLCILSCLTTLVVADPIRVACVGDSITFGAGIKDRKENSYPAQLQRLLGDTYEVKNFGVNGATMLNAGDKPYTKQGAYKASLDFTPNVVVIKLGSNDSKPHNWKHGDSYTTDAAALVQSYQNLPSKPRIILCTPVPAYKNDKGKNVYGITDEVIAKQQLPGLIKLTNEKQLELINLHQEYALEGDKKAIAMTPDRIHPGADGAKVIAGRVAYQLTHNYEPAFDITSKLKEQGVEPKVSNFHGYRQYRFTTPDTKLKCIIVAPHSADASKPWIWRARFFGHQPALDIALLDRGYHVCFVDVADLFGSPNATKRWDQFYALSQQLGLGAKPVLEGMSRGGLIIFNWAKQNPDKVTAIYGDNPVCDIRSWPAKKSKPLWNTCMKQYGITAEQAKDFKGNPIDGLDALAKANVPVMLVLGAKDDVVPIKDNALILQERYKKLGATKIHTWINPNTKHHPHQACPIRELLSAVLSAGAQKAGSTVK
ncbi:hypothetical protein Rhal01_02003 [Rubritalea halochordaticola]|uniref:SGNH hydrolase-type esterase domain-containing protein n=1 Tax=Rubritalea halochordaticola TaxID=714537 RepID=A0ABP9UZE3_9BACT